VVAALNFGSIVGATDLSAFDAIRTPGVSAILLLSGFFFLTAWKDSAMLRGVQICTFLLGGVATAIGSVPGNITSALFAIYGIVLVNEYANAKSRLIPSLGIGVAYMAIFVITAQLDTRQPVFYLLSATVFTGQIVLLFALVTYRQAMIRRRYSEQLESMVEERTGELRVAVLERDEVIRELHHRVGNSLQLLESYVRLQRGELQQEQSDALLLTELRVHAIAEVHAQLHRQNHLTHIPLREFALEQISSTWYRYEERAVVDAKVETTLNAHIDFLLSFAIILTELIANAAVHGSVPGGPKARISVSLTERDGQLHLTVRDSRPSSPAGFQGGIGAIFVDQLVNQQRGTVARSTRPDGLLVEVHFPVESVEVTAPL